MNKLTVNFKREYWEYRKLILGLPIILSSLILIASIVANLAGGFYHESAETSLSHSQTEGAEQPVADSERIRSGRESLRVNPVAAGDSDDEGQWDAFSFAAMYISFAWLAGFYYLLSSLYVDRKDKSILYWKSLPVSETQNILTKLVIGCLGIVLVSVAFAWLTSLLLTLTGLGSGDSGAAHGRFSPVDLYLKPIAVVFFGAIWGAPIFTYILMVSAMSKRLPFFLLILPPIVLFALEGIFFQTSRLISFVGAHLPHAVFEPISDTDGFTTLLRYFLVERSGSLLVGLVVSTVFIFVAVWHRNHKFEI